MWTEKPKDGSLSSEYEHLVSLRETSPESTMTTTSLGAKTAF